MRITKYLHSCIELKLGGQRLLFDPGRFSFIENRLKPKEIPTPDAVFITHGHADHLDVDALRTICGGKPICTYGHKVTSDMLTKKGLATKTVQGGDELSIGPFQIDVFGGDHAKLPIAVPPNLGFLVNDIVFNPGDSFAHNVGYVDVLLLPVAGPWLTINDALVFAFSIKPKLVIPVHDGMIKDFALKSLYETHLGPPLAAEDIEFRPLGLGESVEI